MHFFSQILAAATLICPVFLGQATGKAASSAEAPHRREYLYVGGEYANTPDGETIFQNQMYVEKLSPTDGSTRKFPIVFVHGRGQSGTNWLNKPDGGVGWASRFLEQGYEVYIVDQTTRGRSPWWPESGFGQSVFSAEHILERFTDIRDSDDWPQAKLHTQWPGTGKIGDPIFDNYYKSNVQYIDDDVEQETTMKAAGVALLEEIGPAILLTHSQAGLYGWAITDARPSLVKALVQVEPTGPPFREAVFSTEFSRPWGLTTIPLNYKPFPTDEDKPLATKNFPSNSTYRSDCLLQAEPARKLPNLAEVPILIESGEASFHVMYDYCSALFLRQAGVSSVEYWNLADRGINGNAHMQFMEKNSDEIAATLDKWIRKTVGDTD